MRAGRRLPRSFFARDTRRVARDLLGQVLVHLDHGVRRSVRIVETEAYHGPADRASHARFGRTPRAAIMFGPPGWAYVYLVYGTAHCLNAVTGRDGFPAAVLLRAGEPLENCLHPPRGPGNLCRALGVRRGPLPGAGTPTSRPRDGVAAGERGLRRTVGREALALLPGREPLGERAAARGLSRLRATGYRLRATGCSNHASHGRTG